MIKSLILSLMFVSQLAVALCDGNANAVYVLTAPDPDTGDPRYETGVTSTTVIGFPVVQPDTVDLGTWNPAPYANDGYCRGKKSGATWVQDTDYLGLTMRNVSTAAAAASAKNRQPLPTVFSAMNSNGTTFNVIEKLNRGESTNDICYDDGQILSFYKYCLCVNPGCS